MGKAKDLSVATIEHITALLKHSTHSQRVIAKLCNVSQTSVRRISSKVKSAQSTGPQRKGRSGRKKVITPRGQRYLKNLVLENRRMPHKEILQKFNESGCSVSHYTMRKSLYQMGFKSRRPVKKPRLTERMVKARLDWANTYKNFTLDDWNMVSIQNGKNIQFFFS